jgi:hypothetical protein
MTEDYVWLSLANALKQWRDSGQQPVFWLRDDDAIERTKPLERLVDLTADFRVPVALAVIPAHTGPGLASYVDGRKHVRPVVHGWTHQNHAPADQKKQELGLHRPAGMVLDELRQSLAKMGDLFTRWSPVLVPPWNRIDAALIPSLREVGFSALSVFGPPKPSALPLVNSTVDIMDWHGTRGCRPHAALVADIFAQLEAARMGNAPPIGLLTHHLVHDEAAWAFLERLFVETAGLCRWLGIDELLAEDATMPVRR